MNTRGVSTTVNYTMTLGITTLLVIGLLVATGTYVEGHQEQTERMELTVVGQQLVGTLSSTDSLAQSVGDDGDFTVTRDLPESVARKPYNVAIEKVGVQRYDVNLSTDDVDVTVQVTTRTDVEDVEFSGGDIEIEYDPSGSGTLVVDNA